MSITNELRKYAEELETAASRKSEYGFSPAAMKLTAIADRIDAEHEMATSEFWAKINAVPATEENMAEHGWVRLPVDADGEYIHIGDVMAYADNTKPMAVMALVPPAVFLTEDGPRYADMCRHYHAPTVEDVLEEFVARWLDTHHDDLPSLKAEYAAKLRLAGDAD